MSQVDPRERLATAGAAVIAALVELRGAAIDAAQASQADAEFPAEVVCELMVSVGLEPGDIEGMDVREVADAILARAREADNGER